MMVLKHDRFVTVFDDEDCRSCYTRSTVLLLKPLSLDGTRERKIYDSYFFPLTFHFINNGVVTTNLR